VIIYTLVAFHDVHQIWLFSTKELNILEKKMKMAFKL